MLENKTEIVIYKNCKIVPEKNMKLDDITTYLNSFQENVNKKTLTNMGYVKHGLDISVKVTYNSNILEQFLNVWNYVKITNNSESSYYYFVNKAEVISESVIRLDLSLDSINTFDWANNLTDKTTVIREHRDRMYKSSNNRVFRVIDNVAEGLPSIYKVKKFDSDIPVGGSSYKWYLMYKSESDNENTPVHCYALPSNNIKLYSSVPSQSFTYDSFLEAAGGDIYKGIYIDNRGVSNATVNGHDISNSIVIIACYNNNQKLYRVFKSTDGLRSYSTLISETSNTLVFNNCQGYFVAAVNRTNTSNVPVCYPILSPEIFTHTTYHPWGIYAAKIDSVDRTQSTLIKIIELPYPPFNLSFNQSTGNLIVPSGWVVYNNMLEYLGTVDLTSRISSGSIPDMEINTSYINPGRNRSDYFESKLLHSDISTLKYVYDSFSKEIKRELLRSVTSPLEIYYHQSSNISSKLLFKFNVDITEEGDYDNYLVCNRNNEYPIYTSSYLNYIRTGYNYDVKNKETQNAFNWANTGMSVAGSVVGFVVGGLTGNIISAGAGVSLITSAMRSITSNIESNITAQQNIDRKLAEARAQSVSVSQADDLSLLHVYNGNILYQMEYEPTRDMKAKISDLFYYCGYASQSQYLPNLTSRIYFNYIQCEPEFTEQFAANNYLEDISARLAKGVTVYHKFNNTYDFDQEKENFETWLVE